MKLSQRTTAITAGAGLLVALLPATLTQATAAPTPAAVDCSWTASDIPLDQAFDRAADASGAPAPLLKSVSYMQSRWDNHGTEASADGGYGPMNLTDFTPELVDGKGDGTTRTPASATTALRGAKLAGLDLETVKTDANANICAGAAVLASYRGGTSADINDWSAAVTRYAGKEFARQVYATLSEGQSRVTSDGEKVTLEAQPQAKVPTAPARAPETDCPKSLDCEWLPAPYEKLDPADPDSTGNYGNHDLADRTGKGGPKLDYIVIHDTEGSYEGSVNLVQDPSYVAWNYTIRSSDGHVAQHLNAKDVGWQAGNWYVNMHSIGIEHEGRAGNGGWYTEAMVQNSAKLVKYLAKKYDIDVDPQHIIGHDQIPGTVSGATAGMHWDPGPYWDWEHYFDLLGAPIGGKRAATGDLSVGDVVTVRPGFAGNVNPLTECEEKSPGSGPCQDGAPTNFATLYQEPSLTAALAKDAGTRPGSTEGTAVVNDTSARAQAGNMLVVADVQDEWVQVSWAGELAWIHNPASGRLLVKTPSATVSVKEGAKGAPTYGRAYPEETAYPSTIPYQTVSPLEYTLKPGQAYALTDRSVVTDYYRATTYDGLAPGERTDVKGQDVYFQIALAHRFVYVRAADVQINEKTVLTTTGKPSIDGKAKVGRTVTALTGTWTGGVESFSYQWLRDGKKIAGATSQSLVVRRGDAGRKLSVVVTASAPNAADRSATSKAVRVRR